MQHTFYLATGDFDECLWVSCVRAVTVTKIKTDCIHFFLWI